MMFVPDARGTRFTFHNSGYNYAGPAWLSRVWLAVARKALASLTFGGALRVDFGLSLGVLRRTQDGGVWP